MAVVAGLAMIGNVKTSEVVEWPTGMSSTAVHGNQKNEP